LVAECRLLGGCAPGEAKITRGYQLPARYVIHTVGPVWWGGQRREPAVLAACYQNCLDTAAANGIRHIAFPSISTGVYGYPVREAATIAVQTIQEVLRDIASLEKVVFCCFSQAD